MCLCFPLASVQCSARARSSFRFKSAQPHSLLHLLSMLLKLLGSLPYVPVLSTSICPGEICYARLSELFLAQTGSFRLSEELSPKRKWQ
ncbi:hypothetical protein DEO72_LG6g472 [Vigna unguiculata]|uniref:Uncharacterized protein n=1 Tax=Vigna unguiculata TaxID=3917 RepID=A0A4D6M6H8_VIGUN|nr:hypothetical protein DEO72_LG6g472 [Vigna unguiculata]